METVHTGLAPLLSVLLSPEKRGAYGNTGKQLFYDVCKSIVQISVCLMPNPKEAS